MLQVGVGETRREDHERLPAEPAFLPPPCGYQMQYNAPFRVKTRSRNGSCTVKSRRLETCPGLFSSYRHQPRPSLVAPQTPPRDGVCRLSPSPEDHQLIIRSTSLQTWDTLHARRGDVGQHMAADRLHRLMATLLKRAVRSWKTGRTPAARKKLTRTNLWARNTGHSSLPVHAWNFIRMAHHIQLGSWHTRKLKEWRQFQF
jgi:hypothetical protein